MKNYKKSYQNSKWVNFSTKVKLRDGNKCLKCGRNEFEVILQTHHKSYKPNFEPWDYPLSDCITLCKGCHSREHGLVEPDSGWTLISIGDLGGLDGIYERKDCGTEIRYEHITYHPKWGEKIVGSTCIEYLTREDQYLSSEVLKIFKKISDFINKSVWKEGLTKKGNTYLFTTHSHNQIRIYGKNNYYSFQILLKNKGKKWFDFKDFIKVKQGKNLEQVKELGYIVLKGLLTEKEEEKKLLRNIYSKIR
ncbi:hypothetical protein J2Q11_12020 [Tenacibaculum finnmarkense genomovar finnmarkense]|uniref:HNH endonuclease n=1 Tax=Tenacibaculum finnmarkense TaxID=2781243 RepID=UPI001E5A707D|nr:hypothetical protein [Tenacibaculum finnmarkense]MCD8418365.1 hypothetical protein [Tenacibaculum finnmarkense genomovar finnmarkense]MCG8186803.1 hypothetical protein [Tenacibaculum finnmarkense genomovar finnmarkense]MCG8203317.1 hypothetical protein [Tenacibaculum finnmarkense genomovar finnmarkense]MCG8210734.1 hypothetical protein [Tenacibaculum finnmarkense genomovar finnmarkense]MCG8213543.1 hypothetical protein [Tenacibaculum finnmarkense genomovar finnmarkense]